MIADSSLKPMSTLSHGVASFGEQSQAVCSTRLRDSAAGETFTCSLLQIREEENRKTVVDSPQKIHVTATKSGGKFGRVDGRKRQRQAQLPPHTVYECLVEDSRGKSKAMEPELNDDSDEEDSESGGMPFESCV